MVLLTLSTIVHCKHQVRSFPPYGFLIIYHTPYALKALVFLVSAIYCPQWKCYLQRDFCFWQDGVTRNQTGPPVLTRKNGKWCGKQWFADIRDAWGRKCQWLEPLRPPWEEREFNRPFEAAQLGHTPRPRCEWQQVHTWGWSQQVIQPHTCHMLTPVTLIIFQGEGNMYIWS